MNKAFLIFLLIFCAIIFNICTYGNTDSEKASTPIAINNTTETDLYDYFIDNELIPGFFIREYYILNGDSIAKIESFGYVIDDYIFDIDQDGIDELVCNCVYGGDGAEILNIYKINDTKILSGNIAIPNIEDLDLYMKFDPKSLKVNIKEHLGSFHKKVPYWKLEIYYNDAYCRLWQRQKFLYT